MDTLCVCWETALRKTLENMPNASSQVEDVCPRATFLDYKFAVEVSYGGDAAVALSTLSTRVPKGEQVAFVS
jgi:hypothetical protein